MERLWRYVSLLAAVAVLSQVVGQGSAGGYGQAGGGGAGNSLSGGGGFGGGAIGDDSRRAPTNPEDDPNSEKYWTTRTAVLTPGDRVEYTFPMKKGETLMAAASSDAFDPVLVVEDAKGAKLKEVDDRVEGNQSPFIIFRSPEEGSYKLKVICFKPVAGGKFTLKTRTMIASDAKLEKTEHTYASENEERVFVRLQAKENAIYDLRQAARTREAIYGMNPVRIVGPSGVEASDFETIPTPDRTTLFKALSDGDFYVEYQGIGDRTMYTDYREVKPISSKAATSHELEMDPGELAIFELPVAAGQIVRTKIGGKSILDGVVAPTVEGRHIDYRDDAFGNAPGFAWFKPHISDESDIVRVFRAEGTARLVLRSRHTERQKASVVNTESLPAWESGKPIKDSLKLGESRLFLVKSTKSQLMRVFAGATHFLPRLDIFHLNGQLANTLVNRATKTATDDLYFPDAGTFIVRLSCVGHGGSGDFEMKRDDVTTTAYSLGKPETIKFDGGQFGLYAVDLVAGKRYEFVIDSPKTYTRVDLLDDDGQFLHSQAINFDSVVVHYFVPTKSGRHRLWLRGASGSRQFKLQPHTAPNIGG